LLFSAINGTNNGKTATIEQQQNVLTLVRRIELTNPVLSISDPEISQMINGTWYLQYTSPSIVASDSKPGKDEDATSLPNWKPVDAEEGSSNIETKPFLAKGSVNAAGVVVDTSNKIVLQILDVTNRKVGNQVNFDWGKVEVGGSFRQSPNIANRAIVAFDTADISFSIPNTNQDIVVSLGWVFSVIAAFRNGNRDNGWLETTYVDKSLRLGRGNKGTMFILTRGTSI
jgi:PAP_fibrillin